MRPIVSIGVDRSVCTKIKIPEDGFTDGKPDSFGLFDRNFQRLTEVTSDASEGLPWVTRRVRDLGAAIGFASRFDDPGLGMTGDIIPNEETRKVYEMQYELLRRIHRDAVLPK